MHKRRKRPKPLTPTVAVPALALAALLAACAPNEQGGNPETESEIAEASPDPAETVSILRPEIDQPEAPQPKLEDLNVVIGFPEGGATLDEVAEAKLATILASDQLALGLPITLRSHNDSAGSDEANLRASEERGMAVAQWLIDNGVDAERIDVIAFGEQNPAQPNALPDGTPNEAGRAANRRVEVSIPAMELTVSTTQGATAEGSTEAGN